LSQLEQINEKLGFIAGQVQGIHQRLDAGDDAMKVLMDAKHSPPCDAAVSIMRGQHSPPCERLQQVITDTQVIANTGRSVWLTLTAIGAFIMGLVAVATLIVQMVKP
jgi:hypothetical protein